MKKLGFLLVALFALWACGEDDTTPQQEVTCSITAPAEGSIIDLATATSMTIKGDGAVNVGKIESVVLKVNGKAVTEVTKVPFTHDYTFAADQTIGAVKIELTVKGDEGKEKTVTTNVTLKKTEDTPEPIQEVTCALTAPIAGATFDLKDITKMIITGKASVSVGAVESIALKVGNTTITPSPVPATDGTFSYEYTFASDQATGDLVIDLAVKGDKSEAAKTASVTVKLTRTVTPPTATTFTDARDGHVYKFVTIGTQSWMAENLAYLPVINVPANDVPTCDKDPQYFVLSYEGTDLAAAKQTQEYKKYGVLYNWYAAMNQKNATGASADAVPSGVQGICPAGWHLPSKAEWKVLEEFVASELPGVQGNGEDWSMGMGEPEWHYESGLKNVWSALAGGDEWSATSMGDEHPDLKNGARNTYELNIIPSGSSYRSADLYGNWWNTPKSTISFWTTDLQSTGGGDITFDNMNYRPKYSKFGSVTTIGAPVRCVKD